MRRIALALVLALAAGAGLPGCATSPADTETARRAWAERDAERARECRAAGRSFVAGGCAGGGP
jgi:hypothetical protein